MGGGGRRGGDDATGPTSPEPQHPVVGAVAAIAIIVGAFILIPVMLVAVRLLLSATGIAPWTD